MSNNDVTPSFMKQVFNANQRIIFNETAGDILAHRSGTVIGISCTFPMMYIVLLDQELTHPAYRNWTGVNVVGSMLDAEPEL
jgi:hypothetical protein